MAESSAPGDTSALLREAEVARRLSIKVATLRRWRWAGRGPRFVKLGAAVRYEPADIDAFVRVGRRRSTSDGGAFRAVEERRGCSR